MHMRTVTRHLKEFFTRALKRALMLACIAPGLAQTADFPARAVTIVVPYAAGGGGDVLAREHFPVVFAVIGTISVTSAIIFWRELPANAGADLVSRRTGASEPPAGAKASPPAAVGPVTPAG